MEQVRDMRSLIRCLDEMGELQRLQGVDLNLEVGALTELMGERESLALLFDDFKGYPHGYRIISNLFRTCRRAALVMGLPVDLKGVDFLNAWRNRVLTFRPVPVQQVEGGPIFENQMGEEDIDLRRFPTPI